MNASKSKAAGLFACDKRGFDYSGSKRANVHNSLRVPLVYQSVLPQDFFQQPFVRRRDHAASWGIDLREKSAREGDECSFANIDKEWRLPAAFGGPFY